MGIAKRKTNSDTPYSRSCCKTLRRFYDDFDLLPKEIKALLWDSPTMPNFDDLKTAWSLVEQQSGSGFDTLFNILNVYEEERKEAERIRAREEVAREKRERAEAKRAARNGQQSYGYVETKPLDPKHARLVQRVTEEEAVRMLTQRKENKDVKPVAGYTRVFLGFSKEPEKKPEKEITFMEFEPVTHLAKAMHNA